MLRAGEMHLLRLLRNERGMVLPLALGVLTALTISTVAVIDYSTANARSAARSFGDKNAQALAEAGINNAISLLLTQNALDKYAFCPDSNSTPQLPCWNTRNYEGGTATYTGELIINTSTPPFTAYWRLTSTGTVRNPTGGSKPVQRTLTARAPVVPADQQQLQSPSWNYIYSRAPGTGQAFNGCDMTLSNSVAVSSPLFVNGNLCMQNTATIISGGLFVRGSLTMFQNANRVGSASTPINDAHIAKGCKYLNQSSHSPCLYGAGGNPTLADNVWANALDGNAGAVEPPSVLWNDWYVNASPGPYYPCIAPASGEAANPSWVFDSPVAASSASDTLKLTYKNNNAGLINLTPSTSYSCKTVAGVKNDQLVYNELSWNATTHVLNIKGTMFIDGSVKIDNGVTNSYVGQGVIYLSGTLLVKNSKLCGKLDPSNSSNCTTSGWDPNVNLITFVANGNGSSPSPDNQVTAGDSVQVVSSHVQGAIYATNVIEIGTTSNVDGPLDGSTVILGQTSNSAFPPFTLVPSGMPGNSAVYAYAQNPEMYSG